MKIAAIELCGFRGFKDKTRLEFPAGFSVITGRNGAGKSTIFDAVDFVLTGTIHKYVVTGAKGGGLGAHIWWVGDGMPNQHYVTVEFEDSEHKRISVTRSREKGLTTSMEQLAALLCATRDRPDSWLDTLVGTTLIRDESIAELSMDLTEQERFNALRRALGDLAGTSNIERISSVLKKTRDNVEYQTERTQRLQAEIDKTQSAINEARSLAHAQTDLSLAEQTIATFVPQVMIAHEGNLAAARSYLAAEKQRLSQLTELHAASLIAAADLQLLRSPDAHARLDKLRATVDGKRLELEAATRALGEIQQAVEAVQQDDNVSVYLAQLAHAGASLGMIDGRCPLCRAPHTEVEYRNAVSLLQDELALRDKMIGDAIGRLGMAQRTVQQITDDIENASNEIAALEKNEKRSVEAMAALRSSLADANMIVDPWTDDAVREVLEQRRRQLLEIERAAIHLESSTAVDRVSTLDITLTRLRKELETESRILRRKQHAADLAARIEATSKVVANRVVEEQFEVVLPLLKELFQRLRPHTEWRDLEIDFGGRVRASLNFLVGSGRNPQFLFSSGQRRAAGLAFLLAVHLSRRWCRLTSLLLDDPVQHVDDFRALNLVEVLAAIRRTGRQVIVAVEDGALAEVLSRRLRSTPSEEGVLVELGTAKNGSAAILSRTPILGLKRNILKMEAVA